MSDVVLFPGVQKEQLLPAPVESGEAPKPEPEPAITVQGVLDNAKARSFKHVLVIGVTDQGTMNIVGSMSSMGDASLLAQAAVAKILEFFMQNGDACWVSK